MTRFCGRKNQRNRPLLFPSMPQCCIRYIQFIAPLAKRQPFTLICNPDCNLSVISLSFSSVPLTIFWTIISVIIFSFNGQFFGSLTHISKKVFKCLPTFTNLNATSAIRRIIGVLRIIATLEHCFPNGMCWSTCLPVSSEHLTRLFLAPTPTTFSMSRLQILTRYFYHVATNALAPPTRFIRIRFDGQAMISVMAQVLKTRVQWHQKWFNVIFCINHGVYSYSVNIVVRVVESFRFLRPVSIIT